jgi:hypothetical protein
MVPGLPEAIFTMMARPPRVGVNGEAPREKVPSGPGECLHLPWLPGVTLLTS